MQINSESMQSHDKPRKNHSEPMQNHAQPMQIHAKPVGGGGGGGLKYLVNELWVYSCRTRRGAFLLKKRTCLLQQEGMHCGIRRHVGLKL